MISNLMLWLIHARLQLIMGDRNQRTMSVRCPSDIKRKFDTFGGCNLVFFGDILQLRYNLLLLKRNFNILKHFCFLYVVFIKMKYYFLNYLYIYFKY